MKSLPILLLPILLISCTTFGGRSVRKYVDGSVESKTHLYASLGSKAKGIENSPAGGSILELDDSVSLKNVAVAAGTAYTGYAMLAAQKSNNALSASNYAQGARTDRTKIVSDAAVKKAEVNAEVAKEALKVTPALP